GQIVVGHDPADDHRDVGTPGAHGVDHEGSERHVCSGQHREADRVDVLVDGCRGHGLGGLEQTGVDHLVAGVAQDACDHLDAAIVAVETDLRDENPFTCHVCS